MGRVPRGPRFFVALGFPFFLPSRCVLLSITKFLSIGAKGTAFNFRCREARLHDQCSRAGISEMGKRGELTVRRIDGYLREQLPIE